MSAPLRRALLAGITCVFGCNGLVGLDQDLRFTRDAGGSGGGNGDSGADVSADDSAVLDGAGAQPPGDGGGADGTAGSGALSFFVSSTGSTVGGAWGSVFAADQHCQQLAQAVGHGGRTWRAYLSGYEDGGAVNARDRIGTGPWFNAKGAMVATSVEALHKTLQVPHPYNAGSLTLTVGISSALMLDEKGTPIPQMESDIMTGSNPHGEAMFTQSEIDALFGTGTVAPPPNCDNWASGNIGPSVTVGHANWESISASKPPMDRSWNFSHEVGCTPADLGAARIYCFAAD